MREGLIGDGRTQRPGWVSRLAARAQVLAVAGLLALAAIVAQGCGDDSSGEASTTAGGGKTYKVVLVPGIKGDDFYTSMGCGAKAAAEELGVELDIQAPAQFAPSSQTPIVDAVRATNPDALIIAPTDVKAMYAPIKQVADAGAKIVLVDTTLENPELAVARIASDYEKLGNLAGKTLFELMGGSGKVLAIGLQPGISTLDAGIRGFEAEAEATPSIESLGVQYAQNDQAKVASIVSATLAKEPELKGVFTPSGPDQAGVVNALRRSNKLGDVKVVSADAQPPQVEQLEKGDVQALVAQKPFEMGRDGVEQAVAALDGKPTEKDITTGLVVATKDNLEDPAVAPFLYKSGC